jgi:hypothetical protein
MRFRALSAALAIVGVLPHGSASAEDARSCIAAADDGQRIRDQGKLIDARSQFARCANEKCPAEIRKACASWLADLDQRQPLVVLAARDSHGQDLVQVHVTMDGAQLTDTLDGRAIPVDPGPHTFRFEAPPALPSEQTIVARERDKTRVVNVVMGDAAEAHVAATPVPVPVLPAPETPSVDRTPVYLLGGVGVLALGSFAYFGVTGQHDKNALANSCAPSHSCAQDDVSAAHTKLIVADASLAVGVVALAVATVWLLRSSGSPTIPPPALTGTQTAWQWSF